MHASVVAMEVVVSSIDLRPGPPSHDHLFGLSIDSFAAVAAEKIALAADEAQLLAAVIALVPIQAQEN